MVTGRAPRARESTWRLAGTVHFPTHVRRSGTSYGRGFIRFLLFCSSPRNLFLERPAVMSVRNTTLLYAPPRGCHCRVAREIFSGISERENARARIRAPIPHGKAVSYIIHAIIRIPTSTWCVSSWFSSFASRNNILAIISRFFVNKTSEGKVVLRKIYII